MEDSSEGPVLSLFYFILNAYFCLCAASGADESAVFLCGVSAAVPQAGHTDPGGS